MPEKGTEFSLGAWVIRPQRCSIEYGDERVRIKPKSMAVLECLAQAAGEVVSRNDLFDAVWPGAEVTDDVLTHSVVELRKAFGDSARNARFIETIPKKGFRLIPQVTPVTNKPVIESLNGNGKSRPVMWALLISVCVILLTGALFWHQANVENAPPTSTSAGNRFIAVLPFVDMSPDGDQGYFADGLSEELINRLTRLEGLQVTGRTSSFYFKGRNENLQDIGEILNVGHILEGSVRKSQDQLRITAQLVDVTTGFQLWSSQYDRPFANVFIVQEEIAEAVAKALSIKLSVGGLAKVVGGTTNIEAYEAYMLAHSLALEVTEASLLDAIEHNKRAVAIDPGYALAWAGLASSYRIASVLIFGSERVIDWQKLEEEALAMAVSLAPTSQFVLNHIVLRQIEASQWSNVELTLGQGSNPSVSTDMWTIVAYVDFLVKVGRAGEAVVLMERARRLDPFNPIAAHFLGHAYLIQGRIDAAFAEIERGIALNQFLSPLTIEGLMGALSTRDQSLIRQWLTRVIEHQQPGYHGVNEAMAELLDDPEAALTWLHDSFEASTDIDYFVVIWASYFGDTRLALKALRRLPTPWSFWMPLTAEVRQSADFKEIVIDVGLVDYWRKFGWGDFCEPVGVDDFECI